MSFKDCVGLALLLLCVQAPCTRAACRLRFDVDPDLSLFALSGHSSLALPGVPKPFTSNLMAPANVTLGVTGVMYATSAAAGPCPNTTDGWLAAAATFNFTTYGDPYFVQALTMYPPEIQATISSFPYTLSNVQLGINTTGPLVASGGAVLGPAAGPATVGAVSAPVNIRLAGGNLFSKSPFTEARFDSMAGLNTTPGIVASGTLGVLAAPAVNSSLVVLDFLAIFIEILQAGVLPGKIQALSEVAFTGRLHLTSELGCSHSCGDHGRCVLLPASATAAAALQCVCDYGWTGSACLTPHGYTPESPADVNGTVFLQSAAADSTCAVLVAASNGVCPAGYQLDSTGAACTACASGYTGTTCQQCMTNAACATSLGVKGAQCVSGATYSAKSEAKFYQCSIDDVAVSTLLGKSVNFECSTQPPAKGSALANTTVVETSSGGVAGTIVSSSVQGTTPYCALEFHLSGVPFNSPVQCVGWGCTFGAGSSSVDCSLVVCSCPNGCQAPGVDWEATFDGVSGAVSIDCDAGDASETACTVKLTGVPINGVPVTCSIAECLDEGSAADVATATKKAGDALDYQPVLAFIPLMGLLLLYLTCHLAMASVHPYLRPAGTGSGAGGGADGVRAAASADRESAAFGGDAYGDAVTKGGGDGGGSGGGNQNLRIGVALPPQLRVCVGSKEDEESEPRLRSHGSDERPSVHTPGGTSRVGSLMDRMGSGFGRGTAAAVASLSMRGSADYNSLPAAAALGGSTGWHEDGQHVGRDAGARGASSLSFAPLLPAGGPSGSGSPAAAAAVAAASSNRRRSFMQLVVAPGLPSPVKAPLASCRAISEMRFSDVVVTARGGSLTGRALAACKAPYTRRRGGGGAGTGAAAAPPCDAAGDTTILHGVSGAARGGEVTGVLGPSGSGKTTLLNVLAGQLQPGPRWTVGGSVSLDGQAVPAAALPRLTAHVPQHDLLLRSLSVEECLLYSAALRLDLDLTAQQVAGRVDSVLRELHIEHIRDRVVWSGAGTGAKISGGERQRVSIGMELVTDPSILLLDEPTSGLDSFTAAQLLRTLRGVARAGRVVLACLHQPSPSLLGMLDQVTLLAAGRVVFSGPPHEAPAAFSSFGVPCPDGTAIAEHMLESVGNPQLLAILLAAAQQNPWNRGAAAGGSSGGGSHLTSSSFSNPLHHIPSATCPLTPTPGSSHLHGAVPPAATSSSSLSKAQLQPSHQLGSETAPVRRAWRTLGVLFWRTRADILRNPSLGLLHWAVGALIGLLVGFVFFRLKLDTSGAQDRVGSIFFSLCILGFFGFTAVDLLQSERDVVAREMQRAYYSPTPYMLSKLVLDGLLLRAVPAILFAVPFYWLLGLRPTAAAFTVFIGVVVSFNMVIGSMCLSVAALLRGSGAVILVVDLLLLASCLFSGFLANKSKIPWALRWMSDISSVRYAWEGLVSNELRPLYLTIQVKGLPPVPPFAGTLFLGLLGVDPLALTRDLIALIIMYYLLVATVVLAMYLRRWLDRWQL